MVGLLVASWSRLIPSVQTAPNRFAASSEKFRRGFASFGGLPKKHSLQRNSLTETSFSRTVPSTFHCVKITMASGNGKQFPPQTQSEQPGREHEMDPLPRRRPYQAANKLQGKVALITGGDSGIGRATADLFSQEGATVAITYVPGKEEKDADDTLDIIRKGKTPSAKDPIKIGADLGYDENCKKVVDEVVKAYGKIDILVNNCAEQYVVENFEDIPPEQVERVFRTNIFSFFYVSRHALKHMSEDSCIINTTSINAYKGNASLIDYTATKGAIVAFTRALALHLAPRKIRVNGVAPGPIWTPLIPSSMGEEYVSSFGEKYPMGRAGQPDEVATSFVFLASEDSSYFSGQVLHPNGGTPVNA
ncbi:hypothetical protein R1sor_001612 [Riccia sorocarpa]|uniref:Short-chain dehydrogenase/reductase SDR n=1 Tax=Riccia sorocarpa TaxID=122646 RepID=A0ABD3GZU2_9MARC